MSRKQSRTKLASVLAAKTLQAGASKKLGRQIAGYLLSERRVGELDSLLRDIQSDWAEAGYVEVIARSAHPITKTIESDVKRQVKTIYPAAKSVVVTPVLDPSVIGGINVRLAHQQFDASVQAKLNQFKQLTTV